MKRLISLLVVAVMMLATVLAIVPVSAAKVSDTATATYNVNWKSLVDGGKMESQWKGEIRNDYTTYFKLSTLDETTIFSEPKNGGDTRAYYSTDMFAITATTYYEYVFEAKNNGNNPTGSAGVIFAYGKGDDKVNIGGAAGVYFLYGELQNKSDAGDCFQVSVQFGHQDEKYGLDGTGSSPATGIAKDVNKGCTRYKVVYDGFNVKIYYLNENDQFAEVFPGKTFVLPEGTKVCFGVYSRDEIRTVVLKNCVLTAHNTESAAIINGKTSSAAIALAQSIDKAEIALAADTYTAASTQAANTALSNAKTALSSNSDLANAKTALDTAIAGLKKDISKATVSAKIAEAKALNKADYTSASWDALQTAIVAAQAVVDASTFDVAMGETVYNGLVSAMNALVTKINVMGNSNGTMQFKGEGNVFFYDYHKYKAEKNSWPVSGDDQGSNGIYMLRIGANGGQGTTQVSDGIKDSGGFSHNRPSSNGTVTMTGNTKLYDHAFGYSFKSSVTVDEIKFYLPTNSDIETIDVYGANFDGVNYGKEATKFYLGTFDVADGSAGGKLDRVAKVDYIFFALKFKDGTSGSYSVYEIEMFGIEKGAADFTKLNDALIDYNKLSSSDYEAEKWATVEALATTAAALNTNSLSPQSEINETVTALNSAINTLIADALEAVLTEAETKEESKHSADSWEAFEDALNVAKALGDDAKVEDIVSATEDLKKAMKRLVPLADNSAFEALQALVDEADDYKKEDFPNPSSIMAWGLFEKKLKAAKDVLANESATAVEIKTATEELQTAIANLGENINPPVDPDAPETDDTASDESETDDTATDDTVTDDTATDDTATDDTATDDTATDDTGADEIDPDATDDGSDDEADNTETEKKPADKETEKKPADKETEKKPEATSKPDATQPEESDADNGATETETGNGMTTVQASSCKAGISISALAVVGAIGAVVTFKKKED